MTRQHDIRAIRNRFEVGRAQFRNHPLVLRARLWLQRNVLVLLVWVATWLLPYDRTPERPNDRTTERGGVVARPNDVARFRALSSWTCLAILIDRMIINPLSDRISAASLYSWTCSSSASRRSLTTSLKILVRLLIIRCNHSSNVRLIMLFCSFLASTTAAAADERPPTDDERPPTDVTTASA